MKGEGPRSQKSEIRNPKAEARSPKAERAGPIRNRQSSILRPFYWNARQAAATRAQTVMPRATGSNVASAVQRALPVSL